MGGVPGMVDELGVSSSAEKSTLRMYVSLAVLSPKKTFALAGSTARFATSSVQKPLSAAPGAGKEACFASSDVSVTTISPLGGPQHKPSCADRTSVTATAQVVPHS